MHWNPASPPTKPGRGLTAYVLRTGSSLLCDQALFERLVELGEVELVGPPSPIWLGVPLIVDGRTIGVIGVQDYENARAYGEREQHVLEFVSSQAAKAIQRKRAQEALRVAEEKYHGIFENSTESITQTTPDGKYLAANPAAAHMLGYELPEDLIRDETQLSRDFYVKPGRREEFIREVEKHGSISGFESEVYGRDRNKLWITENSHVVRDDAGRIIYYEGTAQDISARRRAEQALQQRARELQTLYETSLEVSAQTSLDKLLVGHCGEGSLPGGDGRRRSVFDGAGRAVTQARGCAQSPRVLHWHTAQIGRGPFRHGGARRQTRCRWRTIRLWQGRAPAYANAPFHRVLAIPLSVRNRIIGVINVTDSSHTGRFVEDQVRLGSLFADQAALAIESARLYEKERTRSQELATLYASAMAMSSSLSMDSVLTTVVQQVTGALETDECAVSFLDEVHDSVVTMVDYAPNAPAALNAPGTAVFLKGLSGHAPCA